MFNLCPPASTSSMSSSSSIMRRATFFAYQTSHQHRCYYLFASTAPCLVTCFQPTVYSILPSIACLLHIACLSPVCCLRCICCYPVSYLPTLPHHHLISCSYYSPEHPSYPQQRFGVVATMIRSAHLLLDFLFLVFFLLEIFLFLWFRSFSLLLHYLFRGTVHKSCEQATKGI